MSHYTKEELEQYRNKEMPVIKRLNCAAHLKECASCATLLAELDDDAAFVSRLRDSLKRYEEFNEKEACRTPAP